ncbi:MAG: hypothetical protein V4693_12490 [Pseudomonadota bacterium]
MRLHTVLISALLGLSTFAHAQVQQPAKPTPEQMQSMMDASIVSMLPVLARMSEVQMETQVKFAARPDTAERIATFKKNLFDALRNKGFTVEQAMQITNSTPMPVVATLGK